jgi:putative addiction module component (TIGR02574 family)
MTSSARRLLGDVLALPEDERLELASEIIASVDGPRDANWEEAWLAELDRRVEAANRRGEPVADWTDARARILKRLRPPSGTNPSGSDLASNWSPSLTELSTRSSTHR